MNIPLWILQGVAGIIFLLAGGLKIIQSKEKMSATAAWVEDFSATQIRLIGLAEVLGGLGLIIPGLMGILAILTPIAATCLTVLMAGALYTNLRRKETNRLGLPTVLFFFSILIAIGRFWISPF